VYQDRVAAPDLQTSGPQLLDDPACQGRNVPSRVLLDRCDNDALDLGGSSPAMISEIGGPCRF
jgi:hypothetical protein